MNGWIICKKNGISTRPSTHAVHMLSFYKIKYNLRQTDYPNAFAADHCSISLPLFHGMKEEEQDYVIEKVLEFKRLMCGIVGQLNFDNSPVSPVILKKMTDVIKHRGPDGEGHWMEENVGFGHRRLSIIDLSLAGHQPMISADHRYVL